ncbi:unnamed protein product [Meganyctiphanes norvegica]|uniref:Nephrin/kirre n=1 Tax=Meganyctiphanes norvegica TaxID=48144 RepID=A0AAV2RAG6_MEGNR
MCTCPAWRTVMCLLISSININTTVSQEPEERVVDVVGVAGVDGELPCLLEPRVRDDLPKLLLWYKDGIKTPIISYRSGRSLPPLEESLGSRLQLDLGSHSASLVIATVTPADAGTYECRVDYPKSPSHTVYVNFSVIEPPRLIEIQDEQGSPMEEGVMGPYQEDQMVVFTCLARDGVPLPNVTWWQKGELLDGGWEISGPQLVQNDFVVSRLTRGWHNTTITCQAANTHRLTPLVQDVTITMFLRPLWVLLETPDAVQEGQLLRLHCTTEGARPPALMTWLIRGQVTQAETEEEPTSIQYMSRTTSTLALRVSKEDDGMEVACRAANPATPDNFIANTTKLQVHYKPRVVASLGRPLEASLLKEGDDVYFNCKVTSNPPVQRITWFHQGVEQVQNVSEGVILSAESLVLQRVSRDRSGDYQCAAANTIAAVTSMPITLNIRYSPECQTSPTTYFIYDKSINVTCSVTSYPPVHLIQWRWNSSTEVITSKPILAALQTTSIAQYSVGPSMEPDDRLLTCWGVNDMGVQDIPCTFTVKSASAPAPLSSCRLANITASSLSLKCERWPHAPDLGSTLYRAEVYFENGTLFANVTSPRASFNVSRLDAGTSYQIKVYITHGPITSPPVFVEAYTARAVRTHKASVDSSAGTEINYVVLILGGLVVGVGMVLVIVWAAHQCGGSSNQPAPSTTPAPKFYTTPEEANPDVVPTDGEQETVQHRLSHISAAVASERLEELGSSATLSETTPLNPRSSKIGYRPLLLTSGGSCTSVDYAGTRTTIYSSTEHSCKSEESIV